MTRPSFSYPLLVSTLAAALLCPVAFGAPKTPPAKQTQTEKEKKPVAPAPASAPASAPAKPPAKKTKDQKQAEIRAAVAAGKAASSKAQNKKGSAQTPNDKAVAPAPPAKEVAQTSVVKVKPQSQGDKPAGKGQAPRSPEFALIADPAELLSRVPTEGPLGEEHLILHAIATSPLLERRRAAVASARADKRAVQDWDNPELRLSYGSQDENYVRHPYTERSIEQLTSNETFKGTDSTTTDSTNPQAIATTTDTNEGISAIDRYRETVRTITPLKNGAERVETTVYELRTETGSATRDRVLVNSAGQETFLGRDLLADNVTRELTSHSVEKSDPTFRDNGATTFSALIRFRIPHYWERKARIRRASAEIVLAESQYLSEEDRLVREIRERYEALSTLEGVRNSHHRIRESYEAYGKELEKYNTPDFASDTARASMDATKTQLDIFKTEAEIERTKAELASLCGLHDPSRIRSGSGTRRIVDPSSLDPDYLVELGMLYRADAVESRGRLEIAKAHLAEAQSAKIPWASFLDVGYDRETAEDSRGTQEQWMVRLALNFPLWEWTGLNKKGKEYKKAVAAWEVQFAKQRERVQNDVNLAIVRLRTASRLLGQYDKQLGLIREQAKKSLPDIEMAMKKPGDLAKLIQAKYQFQTRERETEISRFEAYSDYNQALMFLEQAIGVRIEKALHGYRQ